MTKNNLKKTTNLNKNSVTDKNTESFHYSKKDRHLIAENRHKYSIIHSNYRKTGPVIELIKRNDKGFYNTICYLPNEAEETLNNAILQDLNKPKKPKNTYNDDDI